ncbi:methyltransferase domain-containing protein [Pedobacter nanyangensis]|uniref:methyltransferase domain-containing protein n=1 Tax=Pedobacter nanyangensis TaxID=1562389 RepID=UPI000DE3DD85|nr:methyltransferase domain-containing protein [Pedobacter nanyangensis]
MAWNPKLYDSFKEVRYQPFYDLASLISPAEKLKAIDLGCGTGEQTALLSEKFRNSSFTGIDSSAEMLAQSKRFENERLHFRLGTIEQEVKLATRYDLVFSNAALQWVDQHELLFPKLVTLLHTGGQLAIQMPVQKENVLNQILANLVGEEPYASHLENWHRDSPVLSMDDYAQILFDHGLSNIQIFQKVYPIIAQDHDALYNFISGTALIPYLDRLQRNEKQQLIHEFKLRIANRFTKLPAIYAFKRILIYGVKR